MSGIRAEYMGMPLVIDDLDGENLAYFKHCSQHDFRLQKCDDCNLLRYPPTTSCPWCSSPNATWTSVEGKGEVHSYEEVHHAIQPSFKAKTPYMVLLVDLDTQKGKPTEDEALRVIANLTPGDFGVVARQHRFRPLPTAAAWVSALEAECRLKPGQARSRIGFPGVAS